MDINQSKTVYAGERPPCSIEIATGKGDETKSYDTNIFRQPSTEEALHLIYALSLGMDEGPYGKEELPYLSTFVGQMYTVSHITISDCTPCTMAGNSSIIEFWELFRSFYRDNKLPHPYIGVPMNLPAGDPLLEFMEEDYDEPKQTTEESTGPVTAA